MRGVYGRRSVATRPISSAAAWPIDKRAGVLAGLIWPLLALLLMFGQVGSPAGFPEQTSGGAGYGKQAPLAIVPNAGQTDHRVRYIAQSAGASFFFTDEKAVFALSKGERAHVLELRFLNASTNVKLDPGGKADGRVSYLSSFRSQTNLPTYQRLAYRDLWPGIDMLFTGAGGVLKYEFRLRPGADPSDIRLAYAGSESLTIGASGNLRIKTPLGVMTDSRPHSYQRIGGRKAAIASRYALEGAGRYGFELGAYDPRYALVIDPGLAYSTYLGGYAVDFGNDIAVDASGSAYVAGVSASTDFPTTPGAYDTAPGYHFITKLSPDGSSLVYSTFLNGTGLEGPDAPSIVLDEGGHAYMTGEANSSFPTTPGAYDTTYNGNNDAYIAKLSPDGSSLVYSSFLGGESFDRGADLALDEHGQAHVIGSTTSRSFPTTPGGYDATPMTLDIDTDAFVTKVSSDGSGLVYSTYLGGSALKPGEDQTGNYDSGEGIALDGNGSAYVTGRTIVTDFPVTPGAYDTAYNGYEDAYVAKVSPDGSELEYSTYLGGAARDDVRAIALDRQGNAHVAGRTSSVDYPTSAGAYDVIPAEPGGGAFVTTINALGSELVNSTFLGDGSEDEIDAIAVDGEGTAHVTGRTFSATFPTTPDAFDATHTGPIASAEAFVTKLNPSASGLDYSTYLGGPAYDAGMGIALDSSGSLYVTGATQGGFATTGAFDSSYNGTADAFVTKIFPASTAGCAVNGAGQITAANGDSARFNVEAQAQPQGPRGGHTFRDFGPVEPITARSIEVVAVVCTADGHHARVLGRASLNGSGESHYRIDITDRGEPGREDSYRIQLGTGYDSGEQRLDAGNLQVRLR